jgi:muramoyltetrapeptide carboxypeptidase LdcA involved in peptidoglycan recycling
MTRPLLAQIIARQDRLADVPVLANADFGHTSPIATFPIGGQAALTVGASSSLTVALFRGAGATETAIIAR